MTFKTKPMPLPMDNKLHCMYHHQHHHLHQLVDNQIHIHNHHSLTQNLSLAFGRTNNKDALVRPQTHKPQNLQLQKHKQFLLEQQEADRLVALAHLKKPSNVISPPLVAYPQTNNNNHHHHDHHHYHQISHSNSSLSSSKQAPTPPPTLRSKQRSQIQFFLLSAFAYMLSPIDLVPEMVFGVFGILDDLIFLFMCLFCVAIILLYPIFIEVRRTILFKLGPKRNKIEDNKNF